MLIKPLLMLLNATYSRILMDAMVLTDIRPMMFSDKQKNGHFLRRQC